MFLFVMGFLHHKKSGATNALLVMGQLANQPHTQEHVHPL